MMKSKIIIGAIICLIACGSFVGCNNKKKEAEELAAKQVAEKAAAEKAAAEKAAAEEAARLLREQRGPFAEVDITFDDVVTKYVVPIENFSVAGKTSDAADTELDALYDAAYDAIDNRYDEIYDKLSDIYDVKYDEYYEKEDDTAMEALDKFESYVSDLFDENYDAADDRFDAAYDKAYDLVWNMDE